MHEQLAQLRQLKARALANRAAITQKAKSAGRKNLNTSEKKAFAETVALALHHAVAVGVMNDHIEERRRELNRLAPQLAGWLGALRLECAAVGVDFDAFVSGLLAQSAATADQQLADYEREQRPPRPRFRDCVRSKRGRPHRSK